MDKEKIIDALRQSQLFAALSPEELEEVAQRAKVRQFFANDVIVWQGQPSTALFLIINGIVAVKNMSGNQERLLAYLMPGNSFGEVGILENETRSATVSALSEVDVLVIQREDFLHILQQHSRVAIELARMLGRYLVDVSRRMSNDNKKTKLILVFRGEEYSGSTSIAALMAEGMVEHLKGATAYMEYPNPWRALSGLQLAHGTTVYHHADGYDIVIPQSESYLPVSTRATLMLDKITSHYNNVVIQVQDHIDEGVTQMLEAASQIIIISAPTREGLLKVEAMQKQIKNRIRQEETGILTVINRSKPAYEKLEVKDIADFEIPYLKEFPSFQFEKRDSATLPKPIIHLVEGAIERLERTNSIGIFIPTTIDADISTDTTQYMDQAKEFMAERFGGATCKVVSGVWRSEQLGLIDEVVYIVHSYITQADMNQYLDEVVDFIKRLKKELKQEAMALEVNHKLTLI